MVGKIYNSLNNTFRQNGHNKKSSINLTEHNCEYKQPQNTKKYSRCNRLMLYLEYSQVFFFGGTTAWGEPWPP